VKEKIAHAAGVNATTGGTVIPSLDIGHECSPRHRELGIEHTVVPIECIMCGIAKALLVAARAGCSVGLVGSLTPLLLGWPIVAWLLGCTIVAWLLGCAIVRVITHRWVGVITHSSLALGVIVGWRVIHCEGWFVVGGL
jgi:hypothetical protein